MTDTKKILITGNAGFIGFHLANRLSELGFNIVGLDIINEYYDVNLKYSRLQEAGFNRVDIEDNELIQSTIFPNYRFIKSDLTNKKILNDLFKKENFNYVINLAAQAGVRYSIKNPMAYIDSNIVGFMNIIECCRDNNIEHLVYASSSSVYGLNEQVPFSTNSCVDHPVSLYAASKKSNELVAHSYSHLYGLPTTGLRFFTVYGPWGRPDMALFIFTKAILEGKKIDVFNNGNMFRDFTYIDDIVEGIIRVTQVPAESNLDWDGANPESSTSKAPYRIYNIGNNNPIKLLDFINIIEKKLNIVAQKNFLPIQMGDVVATNADVSELISDFNYNPSTSAQDGVVKFIDWYLNYFNKPN